jgi:hypothetical protein
MPVHRQCRRGGPSLIFRTTVTCLVPPLVTVDATPAETTLTTPADARDRAAVVIVGVDVDAVLASALIPV